MSQLGYMFIALGVGAWQVAIFHLMTHAFLRRYYSGIWGGDCLNTPRAKHFKMGGLRHKIPLVFWSFVVGGGALVALPL